MLVEGSRCPRGIGPHRTVQPGARIRCARFVGPAPSRKGPYNAILVLRDQILAASTSADATILKLLIGGASQQDAAVAARGSTRVRSAEGCRATAWLPFSGRGSTWRRRHEHRQPSRPGDRSDWSWPAHNPCQLRGPLDTPTSPRRGASGRGRGRSVDRRNGAAPDLPAGADGRTRGRRSRRRGQESAAISRDHGGPQQDVTGVRVWSDRWRRGSLPSRRGQLRQRSSARSALPT